VRLHDGPLRVVGEHHIELHLHADVNVGLTVVVEAAEPANA
jgi:ribosomal protein L9